MGYLRDYLVEEIDQIIRNYDKAAEDIGPGELERYFDGGMASAKDAAIRAAFEQIGLDLPDGPINKNTLTQAIVQGPLADYDLEINNLFDKRELRQALAKVALRKVAESMGIELPALTVEGLKAALIESVQDEVIAQLLQEGGEIFEATAPAAQLARQIASAMKARRTYHTNVATDMSDKGQANREKQARYRANHGRH